MNTKRYQLVFQFPQAFFVSFDAFIAFGDKLGAALPRTHEFDGYDMGSGTINFFVYTNSPQAAFRSFRKYVGTNKVLKKLRVAYREVEGEQFTNLWPKRDSREFKYIYK